MTTPISLNKNNGQHTKTQNATADLHIFKRALLRIKIFFSNRFDAISKLFYAIKSLLGFTSHLAPISNNPSDDDLSDTNVEAPAENPTDKNVEEPAKNLTYKNVATPVPQTETGPQHVISNPSEWFQVSKNKSILRRMVRNLSRDIDHIFPNDHFFELESSTTKHIYDQGFPDLRNRNYLLTAPLVNQLEHDLKKRAAITPRANDARQTLHIFSLISTIFYINEHLDASKTMHETSFNTTLIDPEMLTDNNGLAQFLKENFLLNGSQILTTLKNLSIQQYNVQLKQERLENIQRLKKGIESGIFDMPPEHIRLWQDPSNSIAHPPQVPADILNWYLRAVRFLYLQDDSKDTGIPPDYPKPQAITEDLLRRADKTFREFILCCYDDKNIPDETKHEILSLPPLLPSIQELRRKHLLP